MPETNPENSSSLSKPNLLCQTEKPFLFNICLDNLLSKKMYFIIVMPVLGI